MADNLCAQGKPNEAAPFMLKAMEDKNNVDIFVTFAFVQQNYRKALEVLEDGKLIGTRHLENDIVLTNVQVKVLSNQNMVQTRSRMADLLWVNSTRSWTRDPTCAFSRQWSEWLWSARITVKQRSPVSVFLRFIDSHIVMQ